MPEAALQSSSTGGVSVRPDGEAPLTVIFLLTLIGGIPLSSTPSLRTRMERLGFSPSSTGEPGFSSPPEDAAPAAGTPGGETAGESFCGTSFRLKGESRSTGTSDAGPWPEFLGCSPWISSGESGDLERVREPMKPAAVESTRRLFDSADLEPLASKSSINAPNCAHRASGSLRQPAI